MAGDIERLWLEVALREGNNSGKDAIIRGILDVKNAAQEAAKASNEFAGISVEAGKAGSTLKEVGKIAAGVFTGIKLNDLVNEFADFHKSTMDQTAALVPLASRLRITTDELQALQGASRDANVTNEELTKTLFTFNQNIGQAGQGSKAQIETFEKLGIKILDADGKLRPLTALLPETARALLNIENSSTRASLGAQLLGEKGARLNPLLKELTVPIGDLVERGKSFGQIVDKDIAERLDRAKNSSDAAEQQLRALYATVAAPVQAAALDYIAQRVADLVRGIKTARDESDKLFAAYKEQQNNELLQSMATGKPSTLTPGLSDAAERDRLQKALDDATARRVPRNPHQQNLRQQAIDEAQRALDKFNADRYALRKGPEISAMDWILRNDGLPAQDAPKTAGKTNPPVRGSGGGSNRDRIGEAVEQLRGEVAAAQAAYDALGAGGKTPLEDLQREVELRKKIADEIAKLGKYDTKDPRVKEIEQLVRSHEELETKLKKREEAMRNAVEIERRLGDGTAYLTAEQQRLNEALDTGRLSYEAYSAAMKDAQEKADDMGRKARGAQGGIDAIFAGAEQAAEEWKKANSEFEIGKRLFGELKNVGDEWARTGVFNIQTFGQAMLSMIAQVGAALVQSELMKFLNLGGKGGIGGGGGFLADLFGMGAGAVTSSAPMGIGEIISGAGGLAGGWMPGFAGGGDPPVGMPSIVGEFEPEVIVPKTPSTVLNRAQLAALGVGDGGGSPNIHIALSVQTGSIVSRADHERDMRALEDRVTKAAIVGVAEARGSSSNYRKAFSR
jgi:hypothetical protein